MEVHSAKWSIRQITTSIRLGNTLLDYPIQRADEQWNHKQKSDLVHSVLIGLPIPAVYFLRFYEKREGTEKPVPVRWVLDGKQRLSNLNSYLKDGFKLLKGYEPIEVEGQTFNIAGKKFSDLDPIVQEAFLAGGIPNYTIDKELTTDREIELLFFRLNASKPLTTHQKAKAVVGLDFQTLLNDICKHDTILKLSNFPSSQIRDNKHQTAVTQAMMILEGFEFKNFSANETMRYSQTIRDDYEGKLATLGKVETALNYLGKVFEVKEMFLLKAVSFPMTVALAYKCAVNDIEPGTFYLWSTTFVDALEDEHVTNPTNYMTYTKNGSTDLKKVRGRIDEMERHFNDFLGMLNAVGKE